MAWPERTIQSWTEFTELVDELQPQFASKDEYYFRGQPDASWLLIDSLTRTMPSGTVTARAIEFETESIELFQTQAHLAAPFLPPLQREEVESWWAIMQHFGAPTRLLDWTVSPYVAHLLRC